MTQTAPRKTLLVTEIVENEDNTATIHFKYDDGFKSWFTESQNLKRWSRKRFEKVIRAAIEEYATSRGKTVLLESAVLDPEEE